MIRGSVNPKKEIESSSIDIGSLLTHLARFLGFLKWRLLHFAIKLLICTQTWDLWPTVYTASNHI